MVTKIPLKEQIHSDTPAKTEYYFYDKDSNPLYKSLEIQKGKDLIIISPFTYNRVRSELKPKKIKTIILKGWPDIKSLPKDFKTSTSYGIKSKRLKSVFSLLYPKFRDLQKVTIGKGIKNRFSKTSISLSWESLEIILRTITKLTTSSNNDRKTTINNALANYSSNFLVMDRKLTAGELELFLSSFNSFEKITAKDAESLAKVLEKLPSSKIITTAHFLQTRQKLDIVYLEDIIGKFKKILDVKTKNEEQWHKFFETYSWILNHVFPYQVILRKSKAYVGGKTIENAEGRIVDFLFENNLSDNFALLEIKTHVTELLQSSAYRIPDVFALSDELSGGINQCLDQKYQFLKDFGKENPSYEPATILVIGQKKSLKDKHQVKCFELIRSNNKNVFIVTFDELLSKLEGLLKVITGKV